LQDYLIEMLVCPVCHASLTWQIEDRRDDRIETGTAICLRCEATYFILEGIGLFLKPEHLQAGTEIGSHNNNGLWHGLWRQTGHQLYQYLRDHPDVEHQLVFAPLQTLSPVDQFFRAVLLEARGEYVRARTTENIAKIGLYTSSYLDAWDSQYTYILEHLLGRVPSVVSGPIVDLASGRGYLLNELAQRFRHPIIATDFNPLVLQRNRRWLKFFGLYDNVSLLAFEAHAMPFREDAIDTMVTNLGLQARAALSHVERPGVLLRELRRVLNGEFLAISHFYTEDDVANGAIIQDSELASFLYKQALAEGFTEAGFMVSIENTQESVVKPTPSSDLIPGLCMDELPITETVLEWGIVLAQ
jgi:uncharacterized protein YbaR (Trm112 family)/SAM-dependent methyltransferase